MCAWLYTEKKKKKRGKGGWNYLETEIMLLICLKFWGFAEREGQGERGVRKRMLERERGYMWMKIHCIKSFCDAKNVDKI